MTDVTRILSAIGQGDSAASEQLLPLVYDELRKLASAKMAYEKPGQTLQATGLVHEAYMRLVGSDQTPHWDSEGHFFAAAAEAMRRILVENARRKGRLKRGADLVRHDLDDVNIAAPAAPEEILAVDEALSRLASSNDIAARLVNLRYFAGLTVEETARALGISSRKANQIWAYARVWLLADMGEDTPGGNISAF